MARSAGSAPGPGAGVGQHHAGPGQNPQLQAGTRQRRVYPFKLEGAEPADCRRQRLDHQKLRPGPRGGLFADPGDVDGLLRRRHPVSVAARRHLPELLRLVLRPSPRLANDLGRADRRSRVRRLVQLQLYYRLGLQRPADPNPGRPLLYGSALQGHQNHRDYPGLFGGSQAQRPVAGAETGYRQRAGHGDGPRDPQNVSP